MALDLFQQVDSYPWNDDAEFQTGLNAILGSSTSQLQRDELALRARCFYYARKFSTTVDFDGYKAWRSSTHNSGHSSSNSTSQASGSISSSGPAKTEAQIAPAVLNPTIVPESDGPTFSYADIVDMIKNNKPIPGIKDIPDTVLEGQGTQSKKSTRRKPWEKDDEATEEPVTKGAEQVSA